MTTMFELEAISYTKGLSDFQIEYKDDGGFGYIYCSIDEEAFSHDDSVATAEFNESGILKVLCVAKEGNEHMLNMVGAEASYSSDIYEIGYGYIAQILTYYPEDREESDRTLFCSCLEDLVEYEYYLDRLSRSEDE